MKDTAFCGCKADSLCERAVCYAVGAIDPGASRVTRKAARRSYEQHRANALKDMFNLTWMGVVLDEKRMRTYLIETNQMFQKGRLT